MMTEKRFVKRYITKEEITEMFAQLINVHLTPTSESNIDVARKNAKYLVDVICGDDESEEEWLGDREED